MNKLLLLALLINFSFIAAQTPCSGGFAGSYPCNGLDLQKYYSLGDLGASTGNDSWGWTDPQDGKEYALVGLNNGTFFIDITDPVNPRRLGKLPSSGSSNWWRDIKTYNNHAFIVSEASGHGMQVFDLTRLRGLSTDANRTFTEDAHYSFGNGKAHNIVINENIGYAYIVGTSTYSGGPHFVDISTPTSPTAAGGYSTDGYTHDAQVVTYSGPDSDYTGKEIFVGSNTDRVVILDVTNKGAVVKISEITYPNDRYTHQNWFTEDQRYILVGDEEDEVMIGNNTKTYIFDLLDMDNPAIHFTYTATNAAIDHNGYVRGNRFYLSSYRAGIRIIKIDDIANQNMTEINYFDTWPASNSANFDGAWNVYPYFESGNLIISNYNTGFFIVKDPNYDNTDPIVVCQNITATLNSATGSITITALDLDGGSTDDFGITGMSIDVDTFTCANIGDNDVVFTVIDDYGNESSCTATVTVVGETTEYQGGGSWSNGTPDIGSNAKISVDYDTAQGFNPSIEACTCEIDDNRTLTIQANDYIKIESNITVNGNLIVKHQGSVIQTDADASVIKNAGTGAVINVELTTPVLKTRDFMVMGSPMDTETRTGVFNSAFLVLQHTPANFLPHPGVPAGGTNFADDNGDFWNQFTSGPINVGEGYIVRPQSSYTDPANTTYDMTYALGTLNNGNISRPIVFNGLGTNPDGTPNVLANPYASAIDASILITNNALINEVYFWEHLTPPSSSIPGAGSINFSMDDISMYNGTMGVPAGNDMGTSTTPNGVISTGQGFGIKAFGAGTVTFDNTMRLNTGNTTLRTPQGLEKLTLKVSNNEYNLGSYTGIAFRQDATPQLDANYDSNRLATFIALYSHLLDGSEQLGIQTRESFDSDIKIPLGFASQVEADVFYTISIVNLEGDNLSGATVYLYDNQEEILTDLTAGDYQFKSNKGTFNNRFTLSFQTDDILGSQESALESIVVYPNPTDNLINIYSSASYLKSIEVRDVRGRRLSKLIDEEQNIVTIDISSMQTGIYFVRIETEVGTVTKKIVRK